MKKHIPNFFTLANAGFGFLGIVTVLQSKDLYLAALFMGLGLVCDFLDGFLARLMKVSGELGKQLDSLADVITFGALPGAIVYYLLGDCDFAWLAIVVPIFSVLRLGKFNLDTRQTEDFIGLPTPSHALFWLGIGLVIYDLSIPNPIKPGVIAATAIATSLLTVSPIRMFSFKFKHFKWTGNQIRFVFIALIFLVIILNLIFVQWYSLCLPIIILLYILISIINNLFSTKHEVQS